MGANTCKPYRHWMDDLCLVRLLLLYIHETQALAHPANYGSK